MRRGGEAQDQIERETLPSLIQTGDSFLFRFHLGLQGASQKPKTKDEALHPVLQEITKWQPSLIQLGSTDMSRMGEKEIASQLFLEEEGWQNKGMMLRDPEPVRKLRAPP